MLMTLGIGSRDVYKEDFEQPFLDQSAEFYRVSMLSSWFFVKEFLWICVYNNLCFRLLLLAYSTKWIFE